MKPMRALVLAPAALWLGLLAAAPASADGLERFEKTIKPQIPPGTLTYKSSKALGDNGFALEDVVVTPPPTDPQKDKPEPINIKLITVESLDFDAIEKQQPPLFAKLHIEGISTGANAGSFDLKQLAGLDKLSADFRLDYALAPEQKTFTLNRLELNLNGLARLETSLVLDGVSPDAATNPNAAMDNAALRTANVVYDDHSLLSKIVPVIALMQGTDPKGLIAMATGMLDGARAGQGEKAQKAIDSLVAYLQDYQQPKGPLSVVLNPPSKVSNAQLASAKSADDIVKLLGIDVSYAGTRSAPAAAPSGAPNPSATGPGQTDVPTKDEDPEKKD